MTSLQQRGFEFSMIRVVLAGLFFRTAKGHCGTCRRNSSLQMLICVLLPNPNVVSYRKLLSTDKAEWWHSGMSLHFIGKGKVNVNLYSASPRTPLTCSDIVHTVLPANNTISAYLPIGISQAAPPCIYA